MKRFGVAAVLCVGLLVGCGPQYGGGSNHSYANADRATTTEVVSQLDPAGHLLFVIAWTAQQGGGRSTWSGRNLVTHIHGHSIHPLLNKRTVYALQSDHSLKEIPVTDDQMSALFNEMETANFHTSHSEFWQKKIAPLLIRVEDPGGR